MTLYLLCESRDTARANDMTAFPSIPELLRYIEPIDLLNQEYSLIFDTNGNFYRLPLPAELWQSSLELVETDFDRAKVLTREYLEGCGRQYRADQTIESNASWLRLGK